LAALTRPAFRVSPEIAAALALAGTAGFGPATVRRLIDRHGSAIRALEEAPGAPQPRVARRLGDEAGRELPAGARMLSYGGPGYPGCLARLHDPPVVLWAAGPLPVEAGTSVAVVGTRTATADGRRLARRIARDLACRGIRIISGLARGIDAEAHWGALEAEGETLAVLGSGLNFEYPRLNRGLYAELRRSGALLTEFAPNERPAAHQFPRRNRIVAALADAVLIVQAGWKSGARITASHAADIGVDVLACPGPVDLSASEGCHALLKDGAGLVTCADDVLQALAWDGSRSVPVTRDHDMACLTLDDSDRRIMDRLAESPADIDELAGLVGGPGLAASSLGRLEALGRVSALAATRFERAR